MEQHLVQSVETGSLDAQLQEQTNHEPSGRSTGVFHFVRGMRGALRTAAQFMGTLLDLVYDYFVIEYMIKNSLVGIGPFFPPCLFPHLEVLEEHWEEIRDEVLSVRIAERFPLLQEVEPSQTWETTGKWEILLLRVYNIDIPQNVQKFPKLYRLLSTLDDVPTAMISLLKPGAHIAPHCGYYNGVLRYHLGLKIPRTPTPPSRLGIRVGNQWATWAEGSAIMFDDCYEHEVWNDSDSDRIVLFLDVVRPLEGLPRLVNALFLSLMRFHPTVQLYKRNASQAKR